MAISTLSGWMSNMQQLHVGHIHANCGTIWTCLTITQRPLERYGALTYRLATDLSYRRSTIPSRGKSVKASLRPNLGGG
jgi:hypothetical protein